MEKIMPNGVRIISTAFSVSKQEYLPYDVAFLKDPEASNDYVIKVITEAAKCCGYRRVDDDTSQESAV